MKHRWKMYCLTSSVLLAGLVIAGCSATRSTHSVESQPSGQNAASPNKVGTSVGDIAPDFQLNGLKGDEVKLADLRDGPAVLIFWTAWCPVCKEEAPHFNELAATYEPQGVRVVGINIQDSVSRTKGGVKEFGIKYTVVRDPDASVTRRYKVMGTPTIVFLGRDGVVNYFGNELPVDYPSRLKQLMEQKS